VLKNPFGCEFLGDINASHCALFAQILSNISDPRLDMLANGRLAVPLVSLNVPLKLFDSVVSTAAGRVTLGGRNLRKTAESFPSV
jgi:hypothetical protein